MVDLSLHILDISENCIKALATKINITIISNVDYYQIEIEDNGKGMDEETLKHAVDPFYTSRTTRKVGLGIPLFEQTLEQTGGFLRIESIPQKGTKIIGRMFKKHIDAIPLGDLSETIYILLINDKNIQIHFEYISKDENNNYHFILDSEEINHILDGVPITNKEISDFLKQYINAGINNTN